MSEEMLKKSTVKSPFVAPVKKILRKYHLHSVCESAHCPNIGDCFKKKTATFLILGNSCTRNCRFCNITHSDDIPLPDVHEPENLALAVRELNLSYVVITSVTRDDLEDGGADHFFKVVEKVKEYSPQTLVEVLTPDFKGDEELLDIIAKSQIDVYNHNVETIYRLYEKVRPQADYFRSLEVLSYMKRKGFITKSGIMLGVGETVEEVRELMRDLRDAGCDIMTIGQYFQPTKEHLEVEKDYTEAEFRMFEEYGLSIGFKEVYAGRFVRSSFNASEIHKNVSGRVI
ncbi:MAG TPA: lipoyl synthase [bacterium]|jgi:lipoic acid synthetase|nr:lipoyl synthase [bacterium]HNZ52590.1 lipoyl synthase [bacterium]HOG43443.1 lipoyl synthase [bacterium]HPG34718.1 lipoyl synthase [bacterium]HPM45713.1 lipoyl synthase [bacterium]